MTEYLIGFCFGYGIAGLLHRAAFRSARKRGWVKWVKDE